MAMFLGLVALVILLCMYLFLRMRHFACEVCGSCTKYEKCYKNHVEYRKRNTLECPACEDFRG
ncbi:MAG: hypothetical protein ACRCTZ_16080 [Sarcina sp.]